MLQPFNRFLFTALYDWMVAEDLDPILLLNETATSHAAGQIVYIGAGSVRNAKFDDKGFSCLASRRGVPFTFCANWDEIKGLMVGPEAVVREIRNQPLICWQNERWWVDLPILSSPATVTSSPTTSASSTPSAASAASRSLTDAAASHTASSRRSPSVVRAPSAEPGASSAASANPRKIRVVTCDGAKNGSTESVVGAVVTEIGSDDQSDHDKRDGE